ncbi:MAG: GTPase [Desulfatitalea sp. BRH_c12]|nr:MAG: GTPase [Desulfatitalea sp. BRH_c12]
METKAAEVKEAEAKTSETLDWEGRKAETDRLIKNHTYGSMGVGLIPLPVVDFLALTGIQVRLLYKLSKFYGVDFSKERAKTLIASLIGSYVPIAAAGPLASMIKIIPIIGQTTGALTMLATGGACTYALGKVFVQHFESGGTFLDFAPEKVKNYFADQFKEGQKIVKEGQKFTADKTATQKS